MGVKRVLAYNVSLVWLFYICGVYGQHKIFRVTDFGAIADEKTDNSKAFLDAWRDACVSYGAVILIPKGTFFVSGATFDGPCNGPIFLQNTGTIKALPGPHSQDFWISFYQVNWLTIYGRGTFDGNGPYAWSSYSYRPTSVRFTKCDNLSIREIMSLNSKEFHFHIVVSDNVVVDNVLIRAPGNSPNTDGIHVARCTNVSITNTRIATGDDCISIGDGSKNIQIETVTCGPGHGISIGSLGRYVNEEDVSGVTVKNSTLVGTTNGLRIKTWAPSTVSTTVSDVTFEDINLRSVRNPIIIDQHYCNGRDCGHTKESGIKIDGVKYINVRGTSASPVAVKLDCSRAQPCRDLEFQGMDITMDDGQGAEAVCSSSHFQRYDPRRNVPSKCVTPNGDMIDL